MTRADVDWFVDIRNQVRESLHDSRAFSVEEALVWFETTRPDLRVIQLETERVGYFRLGGIDEATKSLWIGADLHPAFHGRGIASRAYREFMPVLMDEAGVSALILRVRPWNRPAMRLYRRLGFVTIGVDARPPDRSSDRAPTVFDITMRYTVAGTESARDTVDLLLAAADDHQPADTRARMTSGESHAGG